MTYPANFYKVRECPMCKGKDIEIQERYDFHKRREEWKLICLICRYELTQDKPF